jgi:hypothetical protein
LNGFFINLCRRHHHHHHHRDRHASPVEPLTDDQVIALLPASLDLGPEVGAMADLDKDDLASHRFGDNKSFRRHKPRKSTLLPLLDPLGSSSSPRRPLPLLRPPPIKVDHQPHEIFVELDVLSGTGEAREWKEAARWIKYEEDVEEGADRWGR